MKIYYAFILIVAAISLDVRASPKFVHDSKDILPAVAQAIEDELYDLQREKQYFEIDNNPGGADTPAKISMYVSKELTDGTGVVVYKDMPIGEIWRYFYIDKHGTVVLSGRPESDFRPIGGSMLTVYMSNERVCNFIRLQAYKGTFVIDPQASSQRIHDAENRQIQRIGYSLRVKNR